MAPQPYSSRRKRSKLYAQFITYISLKGTRNCVEFFIKFSLNSDAEFTFLGMKSFDSQEFVSHFQMIKRIGCLVKISSDTDPLLKKLKL
ncbi:MAG: hypothetical protein ACW99L_08990 [Promethearchaeota archaeon]|jgi:hypothetical protein